MRASTNTGTPLGARCAATEGELNSVNGVTSGPLFEALTPPPGVWYEAVLTDMSGKVLSNTVHWPAKAPAPPSPMGSSPGRPAPPPAPISSHCSGLDSIRERGLWCSAMTNKEGCEASIIDGSLRPNNPIPGYKICSWDGTACSADDATPTLYCPTPSPMPNPPPAPPPTGKCTEAKVDDVADDADWDHGARAANVDFASLSVTACENGAFDITVRSHVPFFPSPQVGVLFMIYMKNSERYQLIHALPSGASIARDNGADGHYEEIVWESITCGFDNYDCASSLVDPSTWHVHVPAGAIESGPSAYRFYAYNMDSEDRIPDSGFLEVATVPRSPPPPMPLPLPLPMPVPAPSPPSPYMTNVTWFVPDAWYEMSVRGGGFGYSLRRNGTTAGDYDDGKCALAWAIYKNGKPLLTRCAGDELTFNDAQTADIYSITPKPGDRFKAWLQARTRPAGSRAPPTPRQPADQRSSPRAGVLAFGATRLQHRRVGGAGRAAGGAGAAAAVRRGADGLPDRLAPRCFPSVLQSVGWEVRVGRRMLLQGQGDV